jgi:hypothetical protein
MLRLISTNFSRSFSISAKAQNCSNSLRVAWFIVDSRANRNRFGAEYLAMRDEQSTVTILPTPATGRLDTMSATSVRRMQSPQLDKYAKDDRAWRDCAKINYAASAHLFNSSNLFLFFPAATLGHHGLEMYLKAALICEGMTVFESCHPQVSRPGLCTQAVELCLGALSGRPSTAIVGKEVRF